MAPSARLGCSRHICYQPLSSPQGSHSPQVACADGRDLGGRGEASLGMAPARGCCLGSACLPLAPRVPQWEPQKGEPAAQDCSRGPMVVAR